MSGRRFPCVAFQMSASIACLTVCLRDFSRALGEHERAEMTLATKAQFVRTGQRADIVRHVRHLVPAVADDLIA